LLALASSLHGAAKGSGGERKIEPLGLREVTEGAFWSGSRAMPWAPSTPCSASEAEFDLDADLAVRSRIRTRIRTRIRIRIRIRTRIRIRIRIRTRIRRAECVGVARCCWRAASTRAQLLCPQHRGGQPQPGRSSPGALLDRSRVQRRVTRRTACRSRLGLRRRARHRSRRSAARSRRGHAPRLGREALIVGAEWRRPRGQTWPERG